MSYFYVNIGQLLLEKKSLTTKVCYELFISQFYFAVFNLYI